MKDVLIPMHKSELIAHQDRLEYCGITNVTACFDPLIQLLMKQDAISVFELKSQRKDFISARTNTPRNLFIVGEKDITEASHIIKEFYHSPDVVHLLSEITNQKLHCLPCQGQRYVMNGLMENNDTYGWHWDDYSYALIYVAIAPPLGAGGEVECIANTPWIRSEPNIQHLVNTRPIQLHYFEAGNFYLIKSNTTLHRLTNINRPYKRLSITFAYLTNTDMKKAIHPLQVDELY